MTTWTVHLDRLNPSRLPHVCEGRCRHYYPDRRAWVVEADDEQAAIAEALRAGDRAAQKARL